MGNQPIIPLLVYEDIEAAQRFLVEAFGFERGVLERDYSGRVVHGEVSLGGSVLWLHRATGEHGLASARACPQCPELSSSSSRTLTLTASAREGPVLSSTPILRISPTGSVSTGPAI